MHKEIHPKIQEIIDAWISGDQGKAIALTNEYARSLSTKYCLHCGKALSPRAKGDYCKNHRYRDPKQIAAVTKAKNK